MRISATGTSKAEPTTRPPAESPTASLIAPLAGGRQMHVPKTSTSGFTLIEMLVVVLLIGIIATFAVVSIGSRSLDDKLDLEARRLHELFKLAADEAVLQGIELGFQQTANGYAFLYLDQEARKWAIPDDKLFREREIEEPFFLELRVEDKLVAPPKPDDEESDPAPQVLISSSGEMTEFSLRIRAREYPRYFQLQGNLVGEMTLDRNDAS